MCEQYEGALLAAQLVASLEGVHRKHVRCLVFVNPLLCMFEFSLTNLLVLTTECSNEGFRLLRDMEFRFSLHLMVCEGFGSYRKCDGRTRNRVYFRKFMDSASVALLKRSWV